MKPLRLEPGRLEFYRTLKLMIAPFPTCKFTQLELSKSSAPRQPQSFHRITARVLFLVSRKRVQWLDSVAARAGRGWYFLAKDDPHRLHLRSRNYARLRELSFWAIPHSLDQQTHIRERPSLLPGRRSILPPVDRESAVW